MPRNVQSCSRGAERDLEAVTASYRDAIKMALAEELDRDKNVMLLGEDIGQYQGTFKITEGFLQKYGEERIV